MGTVQPVLAWIKMDVKPLMMMMMMSRYIYDNPTDIFRFTDMEIIYSR